MPLSRPSVKKCSLPRHLRQGTRRWFAKVTTDFVLEDHHIRLLSLCCEAWDRAEQARELLSEHGLTYVDRYECPHPRPEVAIERDARIGFARLLRELDLDVGVPPSVNRAPAIRSNRRA